MRRYNLEDATYFVTCVTLRREPLLLREPDLFLSNWRTQPLIAWVVLPDHFHAILQPNDHSVSTTIHRFKITYSRRFRDLVRPGPVWQPRFWDRIIRDQKDMNAHLDYVHFNPVKHGKSSSAREYAYSSFSEFVQAGRYEAGWGMTGRGMIWRRPPRRIVRLGGLRNPTSGLSESLRM